MEIINNAHAVPGEPIIDEDTTKTNDTFTGEQILAPEETTAEPSLSIYEQIKGVPFTINFLGLNSELFYDKSQFSEGKTMKMARDIDSFVVDEITKKGLTDSLDSYASVINQLKTILGIEHNERNDNILQKLHLFIKQYRGISAYGI